MAEAPATQWEATRPEGAVAAPTVEQVEPAQVGAAPRRAAVPAALTVAGRVRRPEGPATRAAEAGTPMPE